MKVFFIVLFSFLSISCNVHVERNTLAELFPIITKKSTVSPTVSPTVPLSIPPTLSFSYSETNLKFFQNQGISTQVPILNFTPQSCTSSIPFPTGLLLDSNTCSISGTPTDYFLPTDITITASDGSSTVNTTIKLQVEPKLFTLQNGGSGGSLYTRGISYSGNYYYFSGSTNVGIDGLTQTGTYDFFFSKFDLSGNRLWTTIKGVAGSTVRSFGRHGIDSQGNLYVTGHSDGDVCGDGRIGTADVFVLKITVDGSIEYCKHFGVSGGSIIGYNIALDSSNNIYLTGTSDTNFGGSTRVGLLDLFLIKLDSSANLLWIKQFGAINAETYVNGINVDSSGNVYLAGNCWGSLFGNAEIGTYDAFVAKFDSDGNYLNSFYAGASGVGTLFRDVMVDGNGNVYGFGFTQGSILGNTLSGTEDALIVKLDSSLNIQWARQFGGVNGTATRGYGGEIDSNNNVLITGSTTGSILNHTLKGNRDFWLVKYDTNGNLLNSTQLGTTSATIFSLYIVRNVFDQIIHGGYISGTGYDGNTLNGTIDYFITTKASNFPQD